MTHGGYLLGIAGSPRRHGNSEQLLDACLAGAETAGLAVRKLVAAEQGIESCRGCNACSLTGACVIRDNMREVYALLDNAAAVVIASPVFFATVPGVLKALYDRCQPYWARQHVLHEPKPEKRPGGLLVVRGGGDPYGYSCAATVTKSVFAVVGLSYSVEVAVEGVDSPSDMGRHPKELARGREAGERFAKAVLG